MNFLSNPLNRVLLIVAVFVIVAVVAYLRVIEPTMTQYSQSQQLLAQDIQSYADLKRVADQKPLYLALTKQIQARLSGVELTADPRAYIPSYLKQIENLAKDDGLEVTAVTPQATPTPSPAPSGAPGASPGPQNMPGTQAAQNVANGVGGSALQATQLNNASPTPGAPGIPAPRPSQGAIGPGARPGAVQSPRPTTPRANAIAYLNQSFTQVPINMELTGTYSQLQKFLRDLNKFPKLIGVGSVTLTPGAHSGVGETPTLTIVLPITAYRLSPGAAPAQPFVPPANTAPGGASQTGG